MPVPKVNLKERSRQRAFISGITPPTAEDDKRADILTLGPQPGPQTAFLSSTADIVVYGGAAGGGKSYGLLLEPLRHLKNRLFKGIIFRRNSVQIRNPGGLWDESQKLYGMVGGRPLDYRLEWEMPDGMGMKMSHLENDKSVLDWQGSALPYIGFDELTHFSEYQFFYMLSRNRSTSGVKPYIRATTNPDADSWVRKLVDWYIGKDGYPIAERAGVVRWFIRIDDKLHWAESFEQLALIHGDDAVYATDPDDGSVTVLAKSFTFIPSNVHDNKILMKKNPEYMANLRALSRVERLRLLGGNWNIRATAGNVFRREWFPILDAVPHGWTRCLRYWDRAATEPNPENKDPDWTRGVKMYSYPNGTFLIADVRSIRSTPGRVEAFIKTVASHDGPGVEIMSQTDPGSAGKAEAEYFIRMLRGYVVSTETLTKDKVTRAKPLSAQAEVGNIFVLRGDWNEDFFTEYENFPDGAHDDQVDGGSGAFNKLSGVETWGDAV